MFFRPILAAGFAVLLSLPAAAVEIGDDGLHKEAWMRETFKDLGEDLAEANAEGKRLMILIEQRGCSYCAHMHEKVFSREDIAQMLADDFFVVQVNMFGDVEVIDLDGEVMPEKDAVGRWGALFTPTMIFLPEEAPEDATAASAAVVTMPGAFEYGTTLDLLTWVKEKGYDGDEPFQKYHARRHNERTAKQ